MATSYIVVDFESFYSTKAGYTLRKMTPPEYILDPRFECIGCAIAEGDHGAPFWRDGEALKNYFRGKKEAQRRGEKLVVLSHNALFDMCLLAWRFGLIPDLMVDTMGMARATVQAKTGYVSLEKVADFLGLGAKGKTILKVDGMTGADIRAAGLWNEYIEYAKTDASLCRAIYTKLQPQFPVQELLVMDMVIRCAVKPRFQVNTDLLHEHLAQVVANKAQLLARTGMDSREALMSNEKFAEVLRSFGVEPPRKVSLKTGKETWAFAKADHAFAELLDHDDENVQTLVAARLEHKSTLEETRTKRLISIASLTWPGNSHGWMPMPLRYAAAHTHRLGGDWKVNVQNLGRGSPLRHSLEAPVGCVVVTCDASQIEARIVSWLAGCTALVQAFANGQDVYSLFASEHVYHRPVSKKTPKERFVGKQAVLGLGFGMGWPRFQSQVRKDSRLQLKEELFLTDEEAQGVVNGYRQGYPEVPAAWTTLGRLIPRLARGETGMSFGPMEVREPYTLTGPTGLTLQYHDLRQRENGEGRKEWVFKSGLDDNIKLFGGKFMENIVQHLARCANFDAALRQRKAYPQHPLALQVHDELVYVVPGDFHIELTADGKEKRIPTGFAAEFIPVLEANMRATAPWAAGLPLDCEWGIGRSYGEAK